MGISGTVDVELVSLWLIAEVQCLQAPHCAGRVPDNLFMLLGHNQHHLLASLARSWPELAALSLIAISLIRTQCQGM